MLKTWKLNWATYKGYNNKFYHTITRHFPCILEKWTTYIETKTESDDI